MGAKLTIEGNASGGVKAVLDLQKAMDAVEKGTVSTGKSMKQLEEAASRVVKNNEGPLERYNRRQAELAEMVKRGKLSLDDAEKAAMKYGVQLENAGKRGEKAFGPAAIESLARYAGGFVSLTAVTGMVIRQLREVEQAGQAAADGVINSLGAIGELQQLSGGDPEKFQQSLAYARRAEREGAVKKGQGAGFAFDVFSADLDAEAQEFALNLAREKIVKSEDAGKITTAASQIQRGFGVAEAGSFADVADKLIAGSQAVPGTNAIGFGMAAAQVASQARELGLSDEETMAALVVTGQKVKMEEAGTQVKALLAAIDKHGLSNGKTLAETIAEIEGRVERGEDVRGIIGDNVRAVGGYRLLAADQDRLKSETERLHSAPQVVGRDMLMTDPVAGSALVRERAQARLDALVERQDAERENLFEAYVTEREEHWRKQPYGHARNAIEKPGLFLTDVLQMERVEFDTLPRHDIDKLSLDLQERIASYLDRTAQGPLDRQQVEKWLEQIAKNTEQMEQNQRAPSPQPSGLQE